MALYDERGLNTARYGNLIAAAIGRIPLKNVLPMDDDEKRVYEWAKKTSEDAEKEGRKIIFDIPFDPDDRYDGIYSKSADELAEEVDKKIGAK